MYRPLPDCVTIKESGIEGLGLFATRLIHEGTELGMSHFYWGGVESLQRTPLGAFYNHSDTPNCIKLQRDSRFFLIALHDIKEGEEITVKYTFYEI